MNRFRNTYDGKTPHERIKDTIQKGQESKKGK